MAIPKGIDHRKIASKGGKTSAANMTPEERSERARKAATARWEAERQRAFAEMVKDSQES